jgi:putative Holliday junction resolvase|tara:strand:+ start:4245 stop:4700 length:456 start_codon:yes stop_codon:yes gene_type:complete
MVTLDELKDKLASNARLIGLDLGTKRIGIAICDDKRKIASPYKTIEYKNMDYLVNELKNIIKDNNIFAVIIGNPINMDGSFGKSAQSINDKAKVIEKELDLIIAMWDERLSTSGAFNISSNLDINFSKKKKNIDEKAAAFILQGALDYLNN